MQFRSRQFLLLAIILILLLSGMVNFYRQIGRLLLPLYTQTIHLLLPDAWHIASLQLTRQGHEEFITARIETYTPFYLEGNIISTGVGVNGSTLLSHAMLPPLIMLSSLFIWLCLSPRRTILPVIFLSFFLLLIESLDVPMVLVGSLWDVLHASIGSHSPVPWQIRAMNLLDGGGRQALSLAAVFAAVNLGGRDQPQALQDFSQRKSADIPPPAKHLPSNT